MFVNAKNEDARLPGRGALLAQPSGCRGARRREDRNIEDRERKGDEEIEAPESIRLNECTCTGPSEKRGVIQRGKGWAT